MLTPAEAEKIISQSVPLLPAEDCPLSEAHGRVLRAPVVADRDLPPYDRVTMDGYALRAHSLAGGQRDFRVLGTQAAGMIPLSLAGDDTCIEVATGAVLPTGADCVVPYEETERDSSTARILVTTAFPANTGVNIHRRASDHPAGFLLIPSGKRLSGREIAVAAACGAATLRVSIIPRIAVIATGDELAEVDASAIAPHQIRRSNDHALRAGLVAAGYSRVDRFHIRDVRAEILQALQRIMNEYDVLLVTGGISKGKFDYLPGVLDQLGVAKKFQGVAQRPGKPFWFGITGRTTPIFALPGNPVSTYTCFCRYVLPALAQMGGAGPESVDYAVLKDAVTFKPRLTYFLPVNIETSPTGQRLARAMATNTSGDLSGLLDTTGFIELPPDSTEFPAGSSARYWPWR